MTDVQTVCIVAYTAVDVCTDSVQLLKFCQSTYSQSAKTASVSVQTLVFSG